MPEKNYYETLQVCTQATPKEIKQSYRRLAKQFHPDSQKKSANHEQIVKLNQAYETLRDPQRRRSYDQQIFSQPSYQASTQRQHRNENAHQYYRQQQAYNRQADYQLQKWLKEVYGPVSQLLYRIIQPLNQEINQLAADPFDDELMEDFQRYLEQCRNYLDKAQSIFDSRPNPAQVAHTAASLYHCLNQIGDGINELEFFTLNYDENYLHTGKEMFRIAHRLRLEAQETVKS